MADISKGMARQKISKKFVGRLLSHNLSREYLAFSLYSHWKADGTKDREFDIKFLSSPLSTPPPPSSLYLIPLGLK
jgi:hypothetical protein